MIVVIGRLTAFPYILIADSFKLFDHDLYRITLFQVTLTCIDQLFALTEFRGGDLKLVIVPFDDLNGNLSGHSVFLKHHIPLVGTRLLEHGN